MKEQLLLDVAVEAGAIMLESGAETYRVEDTMDRILRHWHKDTVETLALMTGIVATLKGGDLPQPLTVMKTVNRRSTNMSKIMEVNGISRQFCENKITLEEAKEQLGQLRKKHYNRMLYNLATAGVAVGFAMMLGGNLAETILAGVVGIVLGLVITAGKLVHMNALILDVLSGMSIALMTFGCRELFRIPIQTGIVIVSAMMPIVPGVAITNAIRDTMYGDYLSGCARILEAFLKAAMIALGVGVGMALLGSLLGRSVVL